MTKGQIYHQGIYSGSTFKDSRQQESQVTPGKLLKPLTCRLEAGTHTAAPSPQRRRGVSSGGTQHTLTPLPPSAALLASREGLLASGRGCTETPPCHLPSPSPAPGAQGSVPTSTGRSRLSPPRGWVVRGLLGHHLPLGGWNHGALCCPSRPPPASGQGCRKDQTDLKKETCCSAHLGTTRATTPRWTCLVHFTHSENLILLFYFVRRLI